VKSQHEVYAVGVTSHSNKFKCVNKKKGNRLPQSTLTCCLMAVYCVFRPMVAIIRYP